MSHIRFTQPAHLQYFSCTNLKKIPAKVVAVWGTTARKTATATATENDKKPQPQLVLYSSRTADGFDKAT